MGDRGFLSFPAALAVGLLLASCAGGPPVFKRKPAEPLTWPRKPEGPWIELLLAYGGSGDVERSTGFWEGLSNLLAGAGEVHLVAPSGIAIDRKQNLYVADPGLRAVHVISFSSGTHRVFTSAGSGSFRSPVGVALGPGGKVFVTDSAAGKIYILDASGRPLGEAGKGISPGRPTGIAWDPTRYGFEVSAP